MVSVVLAVVMKSTSDRSKGSSRKLSRKVLFCSPSNTSSSAEEGSPWISEASLSISSNSSKGLLLPACLMAEMMRPGIAPTYVLRWPRISASSWTPPREIRESFRLVALATDMAMEVLPTPGGPTRQSTCPFSSGASCLTARNSRIRSFTFSSPKWSPSSTFRAAATSTRSLVFLFQGSSRHTSR